jgi:hypothetical protein
MFVTKASRDEARRYAEFYRDLNKQNLETIAKSFENVESLRKAMAEILAQVTPSANATVTRMAAIAEKALGL